MYLYIFSQLTAYCLTLFSVISFCWSIIHSVLITKKHIFVDLVSQETIFHSGFQTEIVFNFVHKWSENAISSSLVHLVVTGWFSELLLNLEGLMFFIMNSFALTLCELRWIILRKNCLLLYRRQIHKRLI